MNKSPKITSILFIFSMSFYLVMLLTFPTQGQATILPAHQPITAENLTELAPLIRLGRGIITQIDWHLSGQVLAVSGGWGVWILDSEFAEVAHFPNIPNADDAVWSPSGDILATLHRTEVKLWRISDDFTQATLESTFAVIDNTNERFTRNYCLAWSSDGIRLAVGTQNDYLGDIPPADVEMYNAQTGEHATATDDRLTRQVVVRCRGGAISPNGALATQSTHERSAGNYYTRFSITRDDDVQEIMYTTFANTGTLGTDWHPSGTFITTVYQAGLVNIFLMPREGSLLMDERTAGNNLFDEVYVALSWSSDNRRLLGSSNLTGQASVWTFGDEGITARRFELPYARFGYVYWGAISNQIIITSSDYRSDTVLVLDVDTGEEVDSIGTYSLNFPDAPPDFQEEEPVAIKHITPYEIKIVPLNEVDKVYTLTFYALDGSVIAEYENLPPTDTDCGEGYWSCIASATHPTEAILAFAVPDAIQLYDLNTGELLHSVPTDSDITALMWHPDGNLLMASATDGTVIGFGVR